MTESNNNNNKNTYKKNVALATIYSKTNLTLRQKKILNTLQFYVREQFISRNPELVELQIESIDQRYIENTNTTFDIPEDQLMHELGYKDKSKYYSYEGIFKILQGLKDHTIHFDALGVAKKTGDDTAWGNFSAIIASAERENGCFRIHVPPKIVYHIVKPKVGFQALTSWDGAKCKYAPEIMDLVMFDFQNSKEEITWHECDALKRMLGATSNTFDEYKVFNSRVLAPAIKDINENPLFEFHISLEKGNLNDIEGINEGKAKGRKRVTHVRFNIRKKDDALISTANNKTEQRINAQKMELQSLGVSKADIDKVFDMCRDFDDNLMLGYIKYCTRKGHELRKLRKSADLDVQEFCGVFKSNIIEGKKDYWINIQQLFRNYLKTHEGIEPIDSIYNNQLNDIRSKAKRAIVAHLLQELSPEAKGFLNVEFVSFYADNFKVQFGQYTTNSNADLLVDLKDFDFYALTVFLEQERNIFTIQAYADVLSNKI